MANTIRDYSATPANNTVVDGADISEGCSPAGINDAIRGVMSDLKDVSTGAVALESPAMDSLTVDTTGIVYSGGSVGIGTASPAVPLHIYHATTNGVARFESGDATALVQFKDSGTTLVPPSIGAVSNDLVVQTNNSEAVRITSGGNVGIGNAAPQKLLHLQASGGSTARFQSTGVRVWDIGNDGTSFVIDDVTGGSERLRIDSSGNVGIGTSNPARNLQISDSGTPCIRLQDTGGTSQYAELLVSGGSTILQARNDTADGHIIFRGLGGGSATERMRINSSGRVGIGTTSPNHELEIAAVGATIRLTDNDGSAVSGQELGKLEFYTTDGDGPHIGADIACFSDETYGRKNGLTFSVSQSNNADATEAMRIDSSGNLLLGKTSSSDTIVGCQIEPTYGGYKAIAGSSWPWGVMVNRQDNDGSAITLRRANSTVGSITVTGSSTSYNTSSDYRLKENVVADWDATTRLKQLNPVRFNFIADADTTVDGFLSTRGTGRCSRGYQRH